MKKKKKEKGSLKEAILKGYAKLVKNYVNGGEEDGEEASTKKDTHTKMTFKS